MLSVMRLTYSPDNAIYVFASILFAIWNFITLIYLFNSPDNAIYVFACNYANNLEFDNLI